MKLFQDTLASIEDDFMLNKLFLGNSEGENEDANNENSAKGTRDSERRLDTFKDPSTIALRDLLVCAQARVKYF